MNESLLGHIGRTVLALGLLLGLIAFSMLLYVSDFGGNRVSSEPTVPLPVADSQAQALPDITQPLATRAAQWIFGPPEAAPAEATPAPQLPESGAAQ